MEDKILNVLTESSKALTIIEIKDLLNLETIDDLKAITISLNNLEKNGVVYHSNKDKYLLLSKSHLRKGIVRGNKKGFAFVEVENNSDDIYISFENMNGAIDGDTVLVELLKSNGLKEEGRILKIVERKNDTFVGEIYYKKGIGHINFDDKKVKIELEIPKKKNMNAVNGHKVVVKLGNVITKNRYYGEVIRILGHKDDPGVDILSIVAKYNIHEKFPDEVIREVQNIPSEVRVEDTINRLDLTDKMIFTIDGDDTKDIDDAISCELLKNGNYSLGVHIADVSHYVKEGSALDNEAMERGTSVYLTDRVIPMLPHELSNGICSLNPDVIRLTISCIMEVEHSGKVVNYEIKPSIIKSNIQMTYKKVNEILEQDIIPSGYEKYASNLKLMNELSLIIRDSKIKRGYLDFDTDEAKIIADPSGVPLDIKLRDRGRGENMIEDFMIIANETIANHIFYMDLPFIYRIHEYPKEEKIRSYITFLNTLGYTYKGNLHDLNPLAIQKLLDFIKDKKESKILTSLLLRNMQKAIYLPQNSGHYGLASKCYTHFTSPIRRYPDMTVHRLLTTYLFNNDLGSNILNHWSEKLIYIADHSSIMERSSIECEREVEDMKMAEYMEKHIGEEFIGMISSVMSFGMFVELDNLVEGLVPIGLMNGYYNYDEKSLSLIEENGNKKYTIGDRLRVKVVRASKQDKMIDFEIIKKVD